MSENLYKYRFFICIMLLSQRFRSSFIKPKLVWLLKICCSKSWQALHSELSVAVRPIFGWMFSYICYVCSASVSSLLRGVQSLLSWLTERGSGSCQRSMIDALEMEHSQQGFYCHSWMCRGLQDGGTLMYLSQRLQKPHWFAYTSEAILNVHDIAVAQSLLWLDLMAARHITYFL